MLEHPRSSPSIACPTRSRTEEHPCWLGRGTPPQSGRIQLKYCLKYMYFEIHLIYAWWWWWRLWVSGPKLPSWFVPVACVLTIVRYWATFLFIEFSRKEMFTCFRPGRLLQCTVFVFCVRRRQRPRCRLVPKVLRSPGGTETGSTTPTSVTDKRRLNYSDSLRWSANDAAPVT